MIALYIVFIGIIFITPYYLSDVWSNFIISNQDNNILLAVLYPFMISVIVFWSYGGSWLIIDYFQIKIFRKLQSKTNNESIRKCVKVVLFNQLFVLLPTLYVLNYIWPIEFNTIISPIAVLITLIKVFISGEILYYYVHRLLHYPSIYKCIHKVHHEYVTPIGISSLYCHPIEMLIGNTLTLLGPLYWWNADGFTLYLGIELGFFESVADHSGYDTKGAFHDKHHQLFNCNYGSMRLLDFIHGTLI